MTEKTLSVGELIEFLKKLPQDAPVWTVHDLHYGPVTAPYLNTGSEDLAPKGAVCLESLWLAPSEYDDLIYVDHEGNLQTIKAYQS